MKKEKEMEIVAGITRREFIKGSAVGAGAALVAASGVLSACATQGTASGKSGATGAAAAAGTAFAGKGLNPQDFSWKKNTITDFRQTKLFSPIKIGSFNLTHRMVKSPAGYTPGWHEDVSNFHNVFVNYYEQFAKGGVELVWVENLGNLLKKWPVPFKRNIEVYPWRDLTDAIRKYGAHAGYQFDSMGASIGAGENNEGRFVSQATCNDLSLDDIRVFQTDVINGIKYLKDQGFEAFQLNCAGNNMPQSFMSRSRNRRTDQYGPQSFENRARFAAEIIQGVKRACGSDFVVEVLINGIEDNDQIHQGSYDHTTVEESIEMCKVYEAAGLDCLHLRIGPEWMHIAEFAPDVWFTGYGIDGTTSFGHQFDFSRHWQGMLDGSHSGAGLMINVAEAYKKGGIKIPVGTVTYMDPARGPDFFEQALRDGKVDYYLMNRPLTVDPEYVNKLRDGRIDEIAPCTRCLHCHQDFDMEGMMFECCRVNATTYRANLKKDYYNGCMPEGYEPLPAQGNKKVMVIGGGPAGMEAARIAAQRGYQVTLYEKNSYLGGLLHFAHAIKGGHENLDDLLAYLIRQQELKGVRVVTGKEVDAAFINSERPDAVILATGGKRAKLNFTETTGTKIIPIENVIRPNSTGQNITVVGSNCQAADVILYLQAQGKHVTVVTPDPVNIVTPEQQIMADQTMLGKGHAFHVRVYTWPMIYARGTRVYPKSAIASVGNGEITVRADSGAIVTVKCDTIVEAMDMLPNKDMLNGLSGIAAYAVGDCDVPFNFADAIASGNLAARKI